MEMYVFQRKMSYIQHQEYKATSGLDFNTIQFQVLPLTHGSTLEGKSLSLRFPLLTTFIHPTFHNWGSSLDPYVKNGLAQFPIARVMEELTVVINGKHELRINPIHCYQALRTYTKLDDPDVQQEYAMPDIYSRHSFYNGSVNSPFESRGYVVGYMPRVVSEGIPYFTDASGKPTVGNTPTSNASNKYMVYMSLPFDIFKNDILNVTSITITCKMASDAVRKYCVSNEGSVSVQNNMTSTISLYDAPSCLVRWKIPSQRPLIYKLQNKRYEVVSSSNTVLSTNQSISNLSLSSSMMNFGKARKMYVYVQPDLNMVASGGSGTTNDYRKQMSASTFGFMTGMSVMLNGQTYFSDWDAYRLWSMSYKNGFFHPYSIARGDSFDKGTVTGTGTVVCVDFDRDLPINDMNTIKIDTTFTYASSWYMVLRLYVVFEYDEEIDMMY